MTSTSLPETQTAEVAPLAPLETAEATETALERQRSAKGQFIQGSSGNPHGRPLGGRNKFSEAFLEDCEKIWREGGIKAVREVMEKEPAAYLNAMVRLMPKDILLEARGAGLIVVKLSDEDMVL
jgi:hypothetical protein